jgi:membrane associated rhomboid family serine protease
MILVAASELPGWWRWLDWMRRIRLHYNAPVVLTFSLLALAILVLDRWFWGTLTERLFVTAPPFSIFDPLDYVRLVSHTLGHGSLGHLFSNLTMILLLGPILEERYGSADMLKMMLLTGLFVGTLNTVIGRNGLLGASSIVFMYVTLISIVDLRRGSIPVSFILVAIVFIGNEIISAFGQDNISQIGHIAGAVLGALFGFTLSNGSEANWLVRLVRWVFDRFWILAAVLAAAALLPALVLRILAAVG